MQITSLRLHDYRNYAELSLRPSPGLNVFVGENAAGKTNVLESIFFCALGRSHRTRHDDELIRAGAAAALVQLAVEKAAGAHTITCRLYRDKPRQIKLDETALRRSGELLGCLHVVMFSPEDLRLIKQGPGERRRFLDMELSQLYPAYYYALQQYNTALRQRNALLKVQHATAAMYTPWEGQLAELGAQIQTHRAQFVEKLAKTAANLHGELSGGRERLAIGYAPSIATDDEAPLRCALLKALESTRARDVHRGSTSIGPHRDDLAVLLDDTDVRIYGSQGQQRTAALSLKLSELYMQRELNRELPVLLLDDVLSELDSVRQRCLVQAMQGCQTFLTCTQLAGLEDAGISDMAVFQVQAGAVTTPENGKNGD